MKGIFVGYGKAEKGYIIYNLETKKIMLSISVIFHESEIWNSKNEEIGPSTILVIMQCEERQKSIALIEIAENQEVTQLEWSIVHFIYFKTHKVNWGNLA